jgi:anthranilate/para-aminobenzoate synthase component II
MTTVNITAVENTVVITENGSTTVVTVPVTSTVTAITPGPQGPKGDAGAAYDFIQSSASSVWTINHNLGFKPGVDVYDSGSQQIQAEVSHPSVNQTVILLTAPIAGFARLT